MDGFGGMQSMNLLKLHADICVCILYTFSGAGFDNTHLILRVQPSSYHSQVLDQSQELLL